MDLLQVNKLEEVNLNELENINGGLVVLPTGFLIGGAISFVAGLWVGSKK